MRQPAEETILVIEDDRGFAAGLVDFLEGEGYSAVAAYTGEEGLRLLQEKPMALILLDLRLPGLGGVALLRAVQQLDPPPEVVIITGHASLATAIEAVEAGAAAYLLKPLEFTRLRAVLAKVLERRRLRQENTRLHAALDTSKQQLERLYSLSLAMQEQAPLPTRLNLILQGAQQILGFERVNILLPDAGRRMLRAAASIGTEEALEEIRVPLGPEGGAIAKAFLEQRDMVWEGAWPVPEEWRLAAPYSEIKAFRSKAFVLVPLVARGKAIGVIGGDNRRSQRPIPAEAVRLLKMFAAQAASVLDNAYLYEQATQERRRLAVLNDISRRLSALHATEQILSLIVQEACRLLGAEAAGIRLLEGEDLVVGARTDSAAALMVRPRLKIGESLSGRVVATGQPVLVEDLTQDERYDPVHKRGALEHGFRGFLGVPLQSHGRTLGTLNVLTKDARPFTSDEVSLLLAVGDQAALAIEKGRLYQEAQTQRTRLSQIFESAAEGIITIDERGIVESLNPAAAKIFGYEATEVIGRNITLLMPEPYRSEHDRYLADYLKTGERKIIGTRREVVGRRKDGNIFPMDLAVSEMRLGDRRLFTGIVRDITERKQVEQMKADFVSFATHQLRTPLAGIKWLLELAAQDPGVPEEAGSFVQDARASADRLIGLVNDLLDVSRLERGKLAIVPQEINLHELTLGVVNELSGLLKQKGHRLLIAGADQIPPILADPQLLRQVVLNLVSNAIKYTPSGGEINIRMSHEGDAIRWAIRDSGIGIPSEAQARLFDKFYRAENAAIMETEGTGLGLYLVRLVLERFGGRVWCESEEGQGATFLFTLPLGAVGTRDG